MKTIGLIGGMSWESTLPYYQIINEVVNQKLGGYHSAKIVMVSVDFAEIEELQTKGDWEKAGEILADAAKKLQLVGADFIVICTNTMHKVAPQISVAITVPVLHIAIVTAYELLGAKMKKVALLGTKYTMEEDFYKNKIEEFGIEVIVPEKESREVVNNIIFKELCKGEINPAARQKMVHIINKMKAQGAEGVILGCTELGLLIKEKDSPLPLFDTTLIHAREAALKALFRTPMSE